MVGVSLSHQISHLAIVSQTCYYVVTEVKGGGTAKHVLEIISTCYQKMAKKSVTLVYMNYYASQWSVNTLCAKDANLAVELPQKTEKSNSNLR